MLSISDLFILLVEPSSTQSKYIIQHLQDAGVGSIKGVSSGAEALEALEHDQPDLVISSMYFEDMTGIDLVSRIRKGTQFAETPFMLISSESNYQMLEPIRQAGVIAILPKPFTDADLMRALKSTTHYIDPGELELELFDVENIRVLVVDDSKMSQKVISNVIIQMGVLEDHITTASNGKEAIKYFENAEFDLVITDLNMPVMDGNELTEFIRQKSSHPYVPIMMVTSESDRAQLENVQQAGVSAICDKPFKAANIKNMLSNILNA